jgi:hypothetical protein
MDENYAEIKQFCAVKGKDYSGDSDALAHFKLNADPTGLTSYQIWAVYFAKHNKAIQSFAKNNG